MKKIMFNDKERKLNNIFTIAYSREEANEIGHFIMGKGYEGVQNDSYRYCDEAIQFALNANSKHNINHIYVGVCGCQMIVAKTKRILRKKGLKYIEKKRMFYNLLKQYGAERYRGVVLFGYPFLFQNGDLGFHEKMAELGLSRGDAILRGLPNKCILANKHEYFLVDYCKEEDFCEQYKLKATYSVDDFIQGIKELKQNEK